MSTGVALDAARVRGKSFHALLHLSKDAAPQSSLLTSHSPVGGGRYLSKFTPRKLCMGDCFHKCTALASTALAQD